MGLTFFGSDKDVLNIWLWLMEMPGIKLFQDYSDPDQPNRRFERKEELISFWQSGARGVAAWPENVGGHPRIKQIVFEPNTQRRLGAKGRTILDTPALINISVNNEQKGCLAESGVGYWREKGVRSRSFYPTEFIDDVDWKSFSSICRKLERHISQSAPAKLSSYPIMPDAFERLKAGQQKLWFGSEIDISSSLLSIVN